jgi:Flp pilus assembly protein CpaB
MERLRGFLWLIAGVIVAALAGGVAFIALSRATAQQAQTAQIQTPRNSVVVAIRTVEARRQLTAADVELREVAVEAVPEGAIVDMEKAVGMITLVDLYPGEVLLSQRLLDPNVEAPGGRLALVMAEDEVLMAFPAGDLINTLNVLKAGDQVDFHFTYSLPIGRETGLLPFGQQQQGDEEGAEGEPQETVTFSLLQNITLAAVVRARNDEGQETGAPQGLLLAVSPQNALVLKYMKDVGATVDLVLRAPGAEGQFPVEPVDLDYILNGYILTELSCLA